MDTGAPLVQLAREDALLLQYRRQLVTLPKRIEDLEREKKRLGRQKQDVEAVFDKTRRETRKIELDLEEARAKRARSESRQSVVTSTDQYQALQREMEQLDERIDTLESALLEAMERVEEAERRRNAEMARLQAEEERVTALQAQLRADLDKAEEQITEQSRKRDALVERIEPQVRSLYERVLKGKGDAAIGLVGTSRACGACNAAQPPQVVQLLRQGKGLHTCHVCGRILVWDPEAS